MQCNHTNKGEAKLIFFRAFLFFMLYVILFISFFCHFPCSILFRFIFTSLPISPIPDIIASYHTPGLSFHCSFLSVWFPFGYEIDKSHLSSPGTNEGHRILTRAEERNKLETLLIPSNFVLYFKRIIWIRVMRMIT